MTPVSVAPETLEGYIASCPAEVGAILEQIRALVREAVPDSQEKISYGMPTFVLEGRVLIHFAAFKKHIGIYPPVHGDVALMQAIERYRGPKGNLKIPLSEPMPYDLIERIVQARLQQHSMHARA